MVVDMAGRGPAPKHPSARSRRNDPKKGFRVLDGERDGDIPPWPLALQDESGAEVDETNEIELWNELWQTPQAVVWEETHSHREVAQYVVWKIKAEGGDLKAGAEARQLSDRLGLNPLALMRLQLEIEHAESARAQGEKRRSTPPARPQGGDPRATLRAL